MPRHPLLLTILAGLAGCGPEFHETNACMKVEEDTETCPPADQVDRDQLHSAAWCSTKVRKVTGEGELLESLGYWEGPLCCYPVEARDGDPSCAIGRPYLEDDEPVLAGVDEGRGWGGLPGEAPCPDRARAWLQAALAEHASVAAFNRLSLDLLALGAPADLLAEVQQAALDEVEHARLCFGQASRFAGRALQPGPLPLGAISPCRDRVALARAAVREGCLGETVGAFLADRAAEEARDPEEAAVLRRIAADEARHAALSWRLVAWLMRDGAPEVRQAVLRAFQEPFGVSTPFAEVTQALCDEARTEVLEPALAALLAA